MVKFGLDGLFEKGTNLGIISGVGIGWLCLSYVMN